MVGRGSWGAMEVEDLEQDYDADHDGQEEELTQEQLVEHLAEYESLLRQIQSLREQVQEEDGEQDEGAEGRQGVPGAGPLPAISEEGEGEGEDEVEYEADFERYSPVEGEEDEGREMTADEQEQILTFQREMEELMRERQELMEMAESLKLQVNAFNEGVERIEGSGEGVDDGGVEGADGARGLTERVEEQQLEAEEIKQLQEEIDMLKEYKTRLSMLQAVADSVDVQSLLERARADADSPLAEIVEDEDVTEVFEGDSDDTIDSDNAELLRNIAEVEAEGGASPFARKQARRRQSAEALGREEGRFGEDLAWVDDDYADEGDVYPKAHERPPLPSVNGADNGASIRLAAAKLLDLEKDAKAEVDALSSELGGSFLSHIMERVNEIRRKDVAYLRAAMDLDNQRSAQETERALRVIKEEAKGMEAMGARAVDLLFKRSMRRYMADLFNEWRQSAAETGGRAQRSAFNKAVRARRHYLRNFLARSIFSAWRSEAVCAARDRSTRQLTVAREEFEGQLQMLASKNKALLADMQESSQASGQSEADLKRAFLRGVCALNIEAVSMMQSGRIEGVGPADDELVTDSRRKMAEYYAPVLGILGELPQNDADFNADGSPVPSPRAGRSPSPRAENLPITRIVTSASNSSTVMDLVEGRSREARTAKASRTIRAKPRAERAHCELTVHETNVSRKVQEVNISTAKITGKTKKKFLKDAVQRRPTDREFKGTSWH